MEIKTKVFVVKKLWPFLVSLGGASVMVLAFFIPSVQDQWDRYQSRKVIEEYVELGNVLFDEKRFMMAAKAYAKAFELSEEKRLDIEVKRLNAKINEINVDPEWGSKPPDGLTEIDFQFILHLHQGIDKEIQRASILVSYGIFLASEGKNKEAREAFDESIRLDPNDVNAYINLGNLLDEEGNKEEAKKAYVKAISVDPDNARAHYNLGLLLVEQGDSVEAEKEFAKAIALDSTDVDAVREYNLLKEENQ